jgi:MoaA/NifB/PqqE/SkfB family radical SAM enzyme
MPLSLFKKIVDDVARMDGHLKALKLWKDGEPLLNPELPAFIRYAKEKNIADEIRMTTNGALLHRMAKELIATDIDWIMVSYLAPRDEIYALHTNNAAHRGQVRRNVELLRNLRDKKSSSKTHIAVKMCHLPYITPQDIQIFRAEFGGIADELVLHEQPMNWDNSHGKDLTMGAAKGHLLEKKVCPFAWYELNINFNGEASICPVDWSFKTIVGDARTQTVGDIWNGERLRRFRSMWVTGDISSHPVCGKCTYYHGHEDNIDEFVLPGRQPSKTGKVPAP